MLVVPLADRFVHEPSFRSEKTECETHDEFQESSFRCVVPEESHTKGEAHPKCRSEQWVIRKGFDRSDTVCVLMKWSMDWKSVRRADERELALTFRRLADEWRRETAALSSLHRKVMHPAYQRIIGMGPRAIPLILRELQMTRGHWLWALNAITSVDPTSPGASFSEAVNAWLEWGRANRYL